VILPRLLSYLASSPTNKAIETMAVEITNHRSAGSGFFLSPPRFAAENELVVREYG
jgi:hypothetical protein